MLEFVITAFVTFFVVIDPVGILPVFMALTSKKSAAARKRIAVRAVLLAAATLTVFALVGDVLLRFLGISLPAFRIAGGLLLLLLSIDMILVRPSGLRTATKAEEEEAEESADVAVFPLAVPLIAGPGAMTSVILITGRASGDFLFQLIAILALAAVLLFCLLIFLFASRLMNRLGLTGINVIGRVFGIVLAGLAIQYIVDGVAASFPILMKP
ncbi:MAG TPA: MarC family protein [Xanthobacteraceae bacterium]|nr:MarC family protein [Xanthobacteraceae bacterium]